MTTIDTILSKMEVGKTYRFNDYDLDIENQALRSELSRAARLGLISIVARGCYEITQEGAESILWYSEARKKLLSREFVNDTPPIAWPV
jgi:predicted transcriptional regulator